MARTKNSKPGGGRAVAEKVARKQVAGVEVARQQDTPPNSESVPGQEESEEDDEDDVSVAEKDAMEEELERLVFGDSVGFREGLQAHAARDAGSDEDVEDEDENEGALDGLDDADLFFTDTAGSGIQAPATTGATDSDDDDQEAPRHPPAWEDSDDERLAVSLASVPRLRKLRRTEGEDVISGKEYVKRLRRQFELLHPVPEWAVEATKAPPTKRRRLTNGYTSGESASDDEDMDVDDDELSAEPLDKLLREASGLVRRADNGTGKKRKLRPEILDIQRTKDIAGTQPSAITSLSFHPTLPLLLSSGPASTLYIHHIVASPPAPTANPLLTSLHIKGTPLTTTAFHPTTPRIFLSARRRYFHVWDLPSGAMAKIARVYGQQHTQRSMERFVLSPDGRWMALVGSMRRGGGGVLNILDAHTLQWASQARVEARGGIADCAWWSDSRGLCVAGKSGECVEWSVVEQRVVAVWQDEGAVGTTTLSLGGDNGRPGAVIGRDRWVAVGSSSGIVNVYDRRAWLLDSTATTTTLADGSGAQAIPTHPKPTRMLDQLTTPTSHLVFSPDGQLLVVASRWKKDALRVVHLPSCTVYRNWPTSGTPLGRVTGVAFGPGSDVLAVANEAGKIRLWEIRA